MWPTIWLQEASLNHSCHKLLLEKLCRYGIRGNCLELLKDYLTSKNQLVKFNGEKSNLGTIAFGVPQGSVLGSLLF